MQYRLPRLVGEAVATFEADTPGAHRVAVAGEGVEPLPEDARVAVGSDIAAGILGGVVGPLALLLVGLTAAALLARRAGVRPRRVRARTRRP